ncbi:MFS transporter [Microbacterium saperdae]
MSSSETRLSAEVPTSGGSLEDTITDTGPRSMSRWLWFAYPLALIGVGAIWGAVLQILLARQVAEIVTDPRASAGALGLVVSASSIVAVFAQPVMGRLSDVTRVKILGRRNFWILFGGIAAGAALVATALTSNLVLLGIAWAIAIIPISVVQAALTAVLPERVPLSRRGRMSGLVGMSTILGGVVGAIIASLAGSIVVAYLLVAVFVVLTSAVFALTTKDFVHPVVLQKPTAEERKNSRRLPGFRAYPDFWWTFLGRFTLILGYFFFSSFGLYMLRDYIKVGDGSIDAATFAVAPAVGLSSLFTLVFALVGGLLVDKFGKVRIFVAIASLIFVPAALLLIFSATYPAYLVASGIIGAAFGTYLAVDQVLITRVIPSTANAARDLGVLNVANSAPQVIAPVIAGGIIAATGNYQILFIIMIVLIVIAAATLRFIKSVP